MNGYQWTVLFAAWLGWGFDIFHGLTIGSPEAKAAALRWTGFLSSLLLVGWAIGGIVFGRLTDRIGRTRTLVLTMAIYAVGTAACAFAPNIWVLALFRFVSALGIGGEWGAGAAMVAEVVPEKRRVECGALLYTSAPVGLFLAGFVNYRIAGGWLRDSPETSWRWVFAAGLPPAVGGRLFPAFVREA